MGETIPDVSARVAEPAPGVEAREERGRVVLERRKFGAVGGAVVRAFGAAPSLTVRLDELGSEAWRLMDGRRTVRDIRAELAVRFPGQEDISPRLGRFLGVMVSKGFVQLR